mgnify:CR=1 FL=1
MLLFAKFATPGLNNLFFARVLSSNVLLFIKSFSLYTTVNQQLCRKINADGA